MDEAQAAWEGVAGDVLSLTGCEDPPVDAFELADCCGVDVVEVAGRGAALHEDTIFVDRMARRERQHGLIAHELGHWCLKRANEPNTEPGARYMAGALMLPRRAFERDLRETWRMEELRARHLNASVEMIARRIVNLRDAVASIWDNGRLTARVASPWLPQTFRRLSSFERGLARACLDSGETIEEGAFLYATPVFDLESGWRRVVVVAEAEQLALRF